MLSVDVECVDNVAGASVMGTVGAGVAHGASAVMCAGAMEGVSVVECASDVAGTIIVIGASLVGESDVGVSAVVGACV